MKIFIAYSGCQEFWIALAQFFQSLDKGRVWWYNTLGGNTRSVYILLYLTLFLHYIFPKLINTKPIVRFVIHPGTVSLNYFKLWLWKTHLYRWLLVSFPPWSCGNWTYRAIISWYCIIHCLKFLKCNGFCFSPYFLRKEFIVVF